MQYLGYIYTKKLLIIYLKLRFNWGFDTLLVLHWRRQYLGRRGFNLE